MAINARNAASVSNAHVLVWSSRNILSEVEQELEEIKAELGEVMHLADEELEHVQKMDSTDHTGELQRIGKALAKKVKPQHFENFVESSASLATVS